MEDEAKVEIVDLTRQMAEDLIESVPSYQRRIRPRWVDSLARDIDTGRWRLSPTAIVVATDEQGHRRLQNGQHRVQARLAAQSDRPCPVLLLTRTVDDLDDYLATDAGRARIFADYLRMQEFPNAMVASAIVRTIALHEIVGMSGFTRSVKVEVSHSEMADLWEARDETAFDTAVQLHRLHSRTFGGTAATRIAALYYVVATQAPTIDIDGFLTGLEAPGQPDANGQVSAAELLRVKLTNWHAGDRRPPRHITARTIIKAWNMWIAGERGTRLFVPKADADLALIPEWAKE